MSYLLNKPYTKKQRADFIVEFNHNRNLQIVETENNLIALEVFETFENGNAISHKTEYEKEIELSTKRNIERLEDDKAIRKAHTKIVDVLKSENQNDNIYLSFEVYNNLVKKLKEEKLKKAAAKS